ncbi:hypothetical protein Epro_1169 [Endomicrobium proavitum]|uniref:Uncharacterized protein n=1 Tax=Endomicrobium proavitum TaxID=1408281 RepID=A0A0G3WJT1_9BACT|nr:hypothetical protein Epro_1169 [Endomicrobium proavitum]
MPDNKFYTNYAREGKKIGGQEDKQHLF